MRTRTWVFLLVALVVVAVPIVARDGMDSFNVLISDEDTGFLVTCTEVRIYGIDPLLGTRLKDVPVLVQAHPTNPMRLVLDPGRYELVIWMFYLPTEVHYMYFDVTPDGVNPVNLLSVEFPEELMTY